MKLIKSGACLAMMMFTLCQGTLYAQRTAPNAEQRRLIHHETPDDPYLPNAYNNQRVAPGYRFSSQSAARVQNSTIYTAQVNVNAGGLNILGDAANEPSMAINPNNPNEIVIGWRQFDNVSSNFRQAGWSYTSDGGITWTFPGTIEPGFFRSDPVLDFDQAGNFYYNSLTNNPDYFCKVFRSSNGGTTWDAGVDAKGGDKQWMTIDRTSGVGAGNIYANWTSDYSTCLPGFFTRSTNGGNSYEDCIEVDGNPFWGTQAIGPSGELYVCGGDELSEDMIVVKSMNAQIPSTIINWEFPNYIFMDGYLSGWSINPQGLLGQSYIGVDKSGGPGNGNVYVLASLTRISNSDPGDVMFVKSTDGGNSWSNPMRINTDPSATKVQWFGTMSVAPNGRIDAIWLDNRDAPSGSDSSALYYSYSTDQGDTWSVNEKMSPLFDPHVGYPNQSKMGDYFHMISDNSGAHLAWANTLNGEEDVYYSYITPSINTGVAGNPVIPAFSITPNPTSGELFIRGSEKNYKIEISSLLGKQIFLIPSSNERMQLDISSLPAGIYFVKIIQTDGRISIHKIVKK